MSNTFNKAKETFESGLLCAESVLQVIAEEMDIKSELVPCIASGFCSGMARTNNMCGALTGGILALNLASGRKNAAESLDNNYAAVQKLIAEFENEFGSSNCRELLGCDLSTEDGRETFANDELRKDCANYVGKAAEITRSIIDDLSAPQLDQ